jgi:FkbM family methyltransferase
VTQANAQVFPRQAVYSFDWIGHCITWRGVYELEHLELLERLIAPHLPGGMVLDIGANIGNHTAYFARAGASVIAFEPNPRTFELLKLNTAGLTGVRCLPIAASNQTGTSRLRIPIDNVGGASLVVGFTPSKVESVDCSTARIDDMLDDLDPESLCLIKIDVEGHEAEALEGMTQLLARATALVAVETYAGPAQGVVEATLRAAGFRHFYSSQLRREWLWGSGLSGLPRKAVHGLEAAFLGVPPFTASLASVDGPLSTDFELLLASKAPLPVAN